MNDVQNNTNNVIEPSVVNSTPKAQQDSTFEKPYNLEPNVEATFAYLPFIGLFTSLAIFFVEKKNPFVRFHAIQGIILGASYIVVSMALALTIILAFFLPLVNLIAFGAWCFMMWKAYNKEEYELPIIGKIARDQIKA